jgi:ATP adenylyltransferase
MQKFDGSDEEKRIVYRGTHNFIVLNIFPYTSGHTLVVPYQHIADFDALTGESMSEYVELSQRVQSALREIYKPDGFNIGMNQGSAAGAGVAGHLHMHVVPRWVGDANFMSTVGETRVLPEDLSDTWKKLKSSFTTE